MGARVYDPYTGTFLQTDPIQGGGATPYGYTDGDPVNELDLGGLATWRCGNGLSVCHGTLTRHAVHAEVENHQSSSEKAGAAICREGVHCGHASFLDGALMSLMAVPGLGEADDAFGGGILEGARYTQKVVDQMGQDIYHGFPSSIDRLPTASDATPITGADGVSRTLVRLPGTINGESGNYEWIIDQDGIVNHRFFNTNP
jgi:hypothetical protein